MKTKKTTVSFVSLGCFKNIVDTEVLGGMLERKNVKVVSLYEKSDWLFINTCGFIREAKEESIDEIFNALEKKERGEIKHIAVFGCLIQRYYNELKENFRNIDILWGVNDMNKLAELISEKKPSVYKNRDLFLYNEKHERIITTTPNITFIKISEGCNMKCSFCAIPQIRGPYRSRRIDSIIKEAVKYKKMGVQEINLISQNSTYFGYERSERSELPELLKEISTLDFKWVRVLYLMPEELNTNIIESFSSPSIIPYFDLPFQHVSIKILKGMNRGGGFEKNFKLIKKIRKKFKNATIRSSFIVGFPGETEEDFEELIEFAKKSKIERIGVFGFSPEEGTTAFKQKERIAPKIIEERKEMLMNISDKNIEFYNKKLIGSTQEFIPLGPWDNNTIIGRIKSQAPEIDGITQVNTNFKDTYRVFKIKITGFKNEILLGEEI